LYQFTILVTDSTSPTPISDTQLFGITIEPLATMTPLVPNVPVGTTAQFTSNVFGGVWTSTCAGSINAATGLFTAPLVVGSCTVAYTTPTGQVLNTVVSIVAAIQILPLPILPATNLFTRVGRNLALTVSGGSGTYAYHTTCGSVLSSGGYTAPLTPGVCTVTVIDLLTGQSSSVNITVESTGGLCMGAQATC
jgi:hypothetical protein